MKIYITAIPKLDQISAENVTKEFTNKYEYCEHARFFNL